MAPRNGTCEKAGYGRTPCTAVRGGRGSLQLAAPPGAPASARTPVPLLFTPACPAALPASLLPLAPSAVCPRARLRRNPFLPRRTAVVRGDRPGVAMGAELDAPGRALPVMAGSVQML